MEVALDRFPIRIEDGLEIRPLRAEDREALRVYFRRLPLEDRQLLKDDVTDPAVVAGFIERLDYERVLPLVAVTGRRIVAVATLHRDRRPPTRHVAWVRVTIDPRFRQKGLGRRLVRELMELAEGMGIALLDAEILTSQRGAIRLFEGLGFHLIATLHQHAFDLVGRIHDVLLYSYTVVPPERLMPGADVDPSEVDLGGGA